MMTDAAQERARLTRSAAIASSATALLLIGLKVWAAMRTDSTAMLGSLADTTLDFIASLATVLGVWIASQPADDDHRFGHGKAEALAAMFQVLLIALSAIGIATRAIGQLITGGRTAAAEDGIAVSIIAMAATLALLAWQRHVIRRTGSVAISADHTHYQSDLLLNLAVIGALVMDQYVGIAGSDGVFGLLIAAWLLWGAWRASSEAIDHLMDREWPDEKKDRFIKLLGRHPELRGVHDLRTRTSGNRDFVQFHVWIDGAMTVTQAHHLMDEIEDKLHAEFPDIEILIHPDPEGLVNETGMAGVDVLPETAAGKDGG